MRVIYENTDITDMVRVRACVAHDTCGERCDSLDMTFENAGGWYAWGPKEDDRIIVTRDGYDTGVMYLNTILPEEGYFRVYATALPCAARDKAYRSFAALTVEQIMRICANETGMNYALYGADGERVIPYIQRENESAASFLFRLLKWEGAALKCVNGTYTAIGLQWAQTRPARQVMTLTADQTGVEYRRGTKHRALHVLTPWCKGVAEDMDAPENGPRLTVYYPAREAAQAARWARGALLWRNRQAESLTIESEFNRGLTALARIDVTGGTDCSGEWLAQTVEHDLYNGTTRARLVRCVETIR